MGRTSRNGGSCRGTVSGRQGWWLVPDEFGNLVREETKAVRTEVHDRHSGTTGASTGQVEEELGKKTYLGYLGATSFSLSTYWVSRFPTSGHQALGVF